MKYLFLSLVAFSGVQKLVAQYNTQNISLGSTVTQWNFGNFTAPNVAHGNAASANTPVPTYSFSTQEKEAISDIEQKFTFKNLRIYMLTGNEQIAKSNKNLGNYLTLTAAMEQGKVSVTEQGSGTVNTLHFNNLSNEPIMILAGEIVVGGKQDRVIGKDILLQPKAKNVEVPVFCVEHGRWSPNGTGFQFNGTFGVVGSDVRKVAVVNKNQQAVWNNVAKMTDKTRVGSSTASSESGTGTYVGIKNSAELNKQIEEYQNYFEEKILEDSNYIGFVAVSGDSILSCDIFASNTLYKKHAKELLKASTVQAVSHGKAVSIGAAAVAIFLKEFLSNESTQQSVVEKKGTLLKDGNGKLLHLNYFK